MTHTLAPLALALSFAAGADLAAQIPPKSVLVSTQLTSGNSLLSVDNTGKATSIATTGRLTHLSVALDPNDPSGVWALGGWPSIGSAPVGHYLMSGLTVSKKGVGDGVVGAYGKVNRCHVFGDQLLITIGTVTPGLYARPLTGGSARLLAPITDAFDITTLRGKIYVSTWQAATTQSSIYEVDLSSTPAKVRVVPIAPGTGSAPKVFKAIGTMGWPDGATYLLIGSSDGKVWFVDPSMSSGNAFTVTFGASRGMAEAIMAHPDGSIGVCIATSSGLYKQTAYNTGGSPFYTSTNPITDISVIGGSSTVFGTGCAGSNGVPVHDHGLNSWPYLGNSLFTIEMENGPATTPGSLIIGVSDKNYGGAPLPLSLSIIGAPTCFLNASIDLRLPIATDGSGDVVLPVPIPMSTPLLGLSVFVQWGLFERGVNPAGLITSAGLKYVIR